CDINFFKSSHGVVRKGVVICRGGPVYVHAKQFSSIIMTRIVNVLGSGNTIHVYLLLVLGEASSRIIGAPHVGDNVRPVIAQAICGESEMIGIIVAKDTPFGVSWKTVPPFARFTMAIVISKILRLMADCGSGFQVVRIIVFPSLI